MIGNWIRQKISSTGTGDITLGAAIDSYVPFSTYIPNNGEFHYTIEDGSNRESGIGKYLTAGGKVSRVEVHETYYNGAYNGSSPSAMALTTAATIMVSGSANGLTNHVPVWNQLNASVVVDYKATAGVPETISFLGSIPVLGFDATLVEEAGFVINVGFGAAAGVPMWPFIKWSPSSSGSGQVRWGITLSVGTLNGEFSTVVTTYLEQATTASATQCLFIESLTSALAPAPGSIIIGRIFRDASHANDTYGDDAILHTVGINYLTDKVGTPKRSSPFNQWN